MVGNSKSALSEEANSWSIFGILSTRIDSIPWFHWWRSPTIRTCFRGSLSRGGLRWSIRGFIDEGKSRTIRTPFQERIRKDESYKSSSEINISRWGPAFLWTAPGSLNCNFHLGSRTWENITIESEYNAAILSWLSISFDESGSIVCHKSNESMIGGDVIAWVSSGSVSIECKPRPMNALQLPRHSMMKPVWGDRYCSHRFLRFAFFLIGYHDFIKINDPIGWALPLYRFMHSISQTPDSLRYFESCNILKLRNCDRSFNKLSGESTEGCLVPCLRIVNG